jgi:hypothetical protein
MSNPSTREVVTITLRTEQMPDGTWCAHMIVTSLASESMANAAMKHMEQLFCGHQINPAD